MRRLIPTTNNNSPEYRFQGNLGFGGKYRPDSNTVDCYKEDLNYKTEKIINDINERLKQIIVVYEFSDDLKLNIELIKFCSAKAFNTKIHILDASKSFARKPSKKTLAQLLQMIKKGTKTTFFFHKRNRPVGDDIKTYLDIGFKIYDQNVSYFLFLYVDISHESELIEKFKIKEKIYRSIVEI